MPTFGPKNQEGTQDFPGEHESDEQVLERRGRELIDVLGLADVLDQSIMANYPERAKRRRESTIHTVFKPKDDERTQ